MTAIFAARPPVSTASSSASTSSSAWVFRTAARGFSEAQSLATPATCAKVRSMHTANEDDDHRLDPAVTSELRTRRENQSNPTDEFASQSVRSSGRRDFLNLAVGLGSALVVGQWAERASATTVSKKEPSSPFDEKRLLQQNRRMQKLNNSPADFPGFIREGFEVKVMTDNRYKTAESGLIYLDIVEGEGEPPKDGQQVKFHYIGYNENGRRVDSSYQQGQPARTRLGVKGMIPGFEEGIKSMRPGGKRRMVIPPELGPPVGPSTFFSAKQFEVFDVELLEVKDCVRRTIFLYSDVVCE